MLEKILPIHVDSTMLSCFRQCPRKFFLEFVYGLRPPGLSVDLHAGGCFAAALEETYHGIYLLGMTLPSALQRAHARFLVEWGSFDIPDWKRTAKTFDRVWEAVESYFTEYTPFTDDIKPFIAADGKPTLEYTFAIPLEPCTDEAAAEMLRNGSDTLKLFPMHPSGGPFIYTGRFDMLGQLPDGKPIPKDEKTTGGSIGVDWIRKWTLRSQFMGYVWALQQCSIPAEQMCVRGIAIQKTQIVHAEARPFFSQELIGRWYEQLRRDLWRLRGMWDQGYFDFDFGEACTSYGTCIFMDSCAANEPEAWLSDMEVRRWDPLNKNPASVPDPSQMRAIS